MVNSFILYSEWFKQKFPDKRNPRQNEFRLSVIKQLLLSATAPIPQSRYTGTIVTEFGRRNVKHFAKKIDTPDGKKQISRSCVVCVPAQRKKNKHMGVKSKRAGKESIYECRQCMVVLCIDNCFEIFHTHKDYVK